jgi:hypothetical protein
VGQSPTKTVALGVFAMGRMGRIGTRRAATVLGVVALLGIAGVVGGAPAQAAPACSVWNTTLGTSYVGSGSALTRALAAARSGDHLFVKGTCVGSYRISKNLSLLGNGAQTPPTVLDGGGTGRVVGIDPGVTADIGYLTIRHGYAATSGGAGVQNSGTVTLTRVTITANTTPNAGGGILNLEDMTLVQSSVTQNVSGFDGGGIYNAGDLTTWRTTISGNRTTGVGGGMFAEGVATLHTSVVTGNTASDTGGGILTVNSLTLDRTQVYGNVPDDCVC